MYVSQHFAKLGSSFGEGRVASMLSGLKGLSPAEESQAKLLASDAVDKKLLLMLRESEALESFIRHAAPGDLSSPKKKRQPSKGRYGSFSYGPEERAIWPSGTNKVSVHYFLPYKDHTALLAAAKDYELSRNKFREYVKRVSNR